MAELISKKANSKKPFLNSEVGDVLEKSVQMPTNERDRPCGLLFMGDVVESVFFLL